MNGLMDIKAPSVRRRRLPEWFRVPAPGSEGYRALKNLMRGLNLHTVCESARCPNIGECWNSGTATFMILGDVCTRSCGFCAVKTGRPESLDTEEPERVAEAVQTMGLRHAVVTSVNRDELPDGGARIFAETICAIRRLCRHTKVEVLIPDFQGNWQALRVVIEAAPDILNHNVETVPRLYKTMRPQAKYDRSLALLKRAKAMARGMPTKSGIMVGAGETPTEVRQTIRDIADCKTDILTIGQYLQPSAQHVPVARFYHPDEFLDLKQFALTLGFRHVESGPLVRSSYHAADQVT
ncbi:MAG: lipoyl synthase [Gemmatimonadota bacterium]|nr:lipoyl synthase [Gemmatimonadota bacterium]MDE2953485.1 lipoyl synthase [Gemmatimonadota bacterium]